MEVAWFRREDVLSVSTECYAFGKVPVSEVVLVDEEGDLSALACGDREALEAFEFTERSGETAHKVADI